MSTSSVLRAAPEFSSPVALPPRPAANDATPITFRFGLTGLRWGEEGPAVLMMHGREGRPAQFRHLVEPLLAAGRQVITLDHPEYSSPGSGASMVMDDAMALLEAAVEIRSLDAVIGHSLGGAAVAIALAHGLPAERAVLIASPSHVEGSRYGFADLKIPALIVHDRDDAAVPFADSQAIARAWPGARLLATKGLDHWRVLTDSNVTQQVAEFLTNPSEPSMARPH